MAVNRPDHLVAVGDALAQVLDEVAVEFGNRITDGIWNIDGGRAFIDDRLDDAAQKVGIGAVAVFGTELDVGHEVARKPH